MRLSLVRTPGVVILQLVCDRHIDGFKCSHIERSSDRRTFRARSIVAADIDDQRVVEFALIFDFLDHFADFMVGICGVSGKDISLTDEELLFIGTECFPFREFGSSVFGLSIRPRVSLAFAGITPSRF
jgi:hypothetical protein